MLTLDERRRRGETITGRQGGDRVRGRVLAREALAEYEALLKEHNDFYRTHSPHRSDHAEIDAAINADLYDKAVEIVAYVGYWLEDEQFDAERRAYAIARVAEMEEPA